MNIVLNESSSYLTTKLVLPTLLSPIISRRMTMRGFSGFFGCGAIFAEHCELLRAANESSWTDSAERVVA